MELIHLVLFLAVLLPLLMGAAFLLARHLYRRPDTAEDLSPVTRQHIDLFQGGQLNEAAVESAKNRFRHLLERGEVEAVEASLRPGTSYVVQVRALAELGTDAAGSILERQLHRRISDDQLEQSWYWIDLAIGLRTLNRSQSLPHLLECAETAGDLPLGHFFAAETICILGFAGYVRQGETRLGRVALRVLCRALEGLRSGVQPQVVVEARLGEMIETLWDNRPGQVDPLVVRVFAETLRLLRRAPHAEALLTEEMGEQEGFDWQISRLTALAPSLTEYLAEAPPRLLHRLTRAAVPEQRDLLQALGELRAETAEVVLRLLKTPGFRHAELAVEVLAASRDPRVGPWLREWVARRLALDRRAQSRRRNLPPRSPSVPADLPYRAILQTLRQHGSPATESFLLLATCDWDPIYRVAAYSSLSWWEPFHRAEVLVCLQQGRRDPNPEVRQAARAALARLGERQALQWFRQTLTNEDSQRLHEAIQIIANEGLFLLWPDLDRLADASDGDVAHHAREALERLCEELDRKG